MSELNALRKPDPEADDWLSALFDGELDPETSKRALARLGKDADATRQWAEYSLIGDALRGCAAGRPDLNARIRAALAEEPTVLAPMPTPPDARRPYYYAAAAAAVAAIAWGVLNTTPLGGGAPALPVAANGEPALVAQGEVQAYLAAHQDYAYAVGGEPEMRLTQVSYAGEGR
jgi:sigma-E factor negative regulatory protein RseA